MSAVNTCETNRKPRTFKPAPLLAAVAATMLLSGCAALKRDHVTVGSIPEDYRTNHPITVSEREVVYDVPVTSEASGLSLSQKNAIRGFMENYDKTSGSQVRVIVPAGSSNAAGAQRVAGDIVSLLARNGVPGERIQTYSYTATAAGQSAPVRISYTRLMAATDKCGRWPADLADNAENKHYANFGCASQNNLAAQVANPADLLGPRPTGDIDGTRRGTVIGDYEGRSVFWNSEIDY